MEKHTPDQFLEKPADFNSSKCKVEVYENGIKKKEFFQEYYFIKENPDLRQTAMAC